MASQTELWAGDLALSQDAESIKEAFAAAGHFIRSVRVHNKENRDGAGFAFLEFDSYEAAASALSALNNKPIAGLDRRWRLSWAGGGGGGARNMPEYSVFVGELSSEVDDAALMAFFRKRYPNTVKSAKVVTDPGGDSKGYGFVRFIDENDQQEAVRLFQGVHGLGKKAIRTDIAQSRRTESADYRRDSATPGGGGAGGMYGGAYAMYQPYAAWPYPAAFAAAAPAYAAYTPPPPTLVAVVPAAVAAHADAAGEQGKAPAEVNPLEPFEVQAANEAYMRRETHMHDRVEAMVWEAAH